MDPTPIRAVDKRLRNGRRFTLDLVPQHGSQWSYWMQASVDGEIIVDRFTAPVQRNVSPVHGLPHAISIRFTEPNPDLTGNPPRWVNRPVGLSEAEADAIDAAKQEWTERYARAAREAAPQAPTWQIDGLPVPPPAGSVIWDYDRDQPVMVLDTAERWLDQDGRSFGLDAEEGYLFTATVRSLTDQEQARWDQEQAHDQRIRDAYQATFTLFGWNRQRDDQLPHDAERVTTSAEGEKVFLGDARLLVRTAEHIYARTITGSTLTDGVIRHPATPHRVEVFEVLHAASDRGHLHHRAQFETVPS